MFGRVVGPRDIDPGDVRPATLLRRSLLLYDRERCKRRELRGGEVTLRIPNAIDMHCHFGPDTVGGGLDAPDMHSVTAVEAAREAIATGHAALVLKSHSFATPVLARSIEQAVPGLHLFGGICTDYPSGGLNPDAVEAALALGAKIVWLPTLHSRQDHSRGVLPPECYHGDGLAVVDDSGTVLPVVQEIFELVRQKDAVLATGHISADEHLAVVKQFALRGKVVVTHAGEKLAGPQLSSDQCAELADLGAVIEVTAQMCKQVLGHPGMSPRDVTDMIRTIGPSRCTLSTDYGWSTAVPRPAAGMQEFLEALWGEGVSEKELETMVSANPARLLDLAL
jgi:hypothetical protein